MRLSYEKTLLVIEKINFVIVIIIFLIIMFKIEYLSDEFLISFPLIMSIMIIPRVIFIIEKNNISKIRSRVLIVFNILITVAYIIILLIYDKHNDAKQFYLVSFGLLLVQGGITGSLAKHILISRTDSSILSGSWIVYALNVLYVAVGMMLISVVIIG